MDAGQIETSALIGAWAGLAAGILGAIGGFLGIRGAKRVVAVAPPPASAPTQPPPRSDTSV